jgi:hypothetical protein
MYRRGRDSGDREFKKLRRERNGRREGGEKGWILRSLFCDMCFVHQIIELLL